MEDAEVLEPEVERGEGGEYDVGDVEEAVASAEANGFEVVRCTDTTLLLDLDDGLSQDIYRDMLPSLEKMFGLEEVERWQSKSGIGLHVVLSCDEMPIAQRVAIQACLGSDRVREALTIARVRAGQKDPSVLFRPKRDGQ